MIRRILPLLYLIIGVVVAAQNDYFQPLNKIAQIASALLAVLLWPLVLFGVNLNVG